MDKGNYKDLKWEFNDLLDIGIDENLKVNLDSIIKTEYDKEIVIAIASTITPKPKDMFKLIDNYILLYAL